MTSKLVPWLVVAALGLTSAGCKPEDPAKPEIEVLAPASNGSPIAVKFVKFIGNGDARGLEIKLYNSGDKPAVGYSFVFRYFDADDKLLRVKVGTPFESDTDFTSMSGNRYKCPPNENQTLEIEGDFVSVPAAAVRAEIFATTVHTLAADGVTTEDWFSQERSFGEWPS